MKLRTAEMPCNPKVSVCIPVHNRRALLRTTLWSVLQQSLQDIEVIISDNASEENIQSEVDRVADPRVHYIRLPVNVGAAGNFRFLESHARGEYVLFLCSDDLLLPDCLMKAVHTLDSHPDRGAAVYMAAHYHEDGFKFLSTMPDRPYATAAEYVTDRAVRDFRFASPSLCLYRRSTFERLGGWHRALLAVIDWELYSRVIRNGGGVVFVHDVLAIMRLHRARVSNTTALHWDFYHDVMWLAAQPEHEWSGAYQAMAFVDQLLWDYRLRRLPWATLAHAYRLKVLPTVLVYMPWEVIRRIGVKLQAATGRGNTPSAQTTSEALALDRQALDAFWVASEVVRNQ